MRIFPIRFVIVVIAISFCFHSARADDSVTVGDVSGGLCVQLGASDLTLATDLARTGRFLVHVLDEDDKTIAAAQQQLYSQNLYGLVSIDRPLWDGLAISHGRLFVSTQDGQLRCLGEPVASK